MRTHALQHAHGQQRVPAQLEEVVAPPHAVLPQKLGPYRRQLLLYPVVRRLVSTLRPFGLRQGLAVHLAVGIERKRGQHDDGRRLHIVRQPPGQRLAQGSGQPRIGVWTAHIGDKACAPCALGCDHHGLAHAGLGQQMGLDLAQLDAQAPDLHLVVQAPQVLQLAFFVPAHQVARAVQQAALRVQRVGHKALGRQCGAVQIAARQAHASQVQLAGHALWRRPHGGVQHIGADAADGPADGNLAPPVVAAAPVGDVDGRLGRAVEVVETGPGQEPEDGVLRLGRQGLAAAQDAPEARACRNARVRHKGLQYGRHEVHGGDAMARDQRHQSGGVTVIARRGHHQPGAGHQGPEELPD